MRRDAFGRHVEGGEDSDLYLSRWGHTTRTSQIKESYLMDGSSASLYINPWLALGVTSVGKQVKIWGAAPTARSRVPEFPPDLQFVNSLSTRHSLPFKS